eukprot:5324173-Lingulodinium_polyedra.AAC.1
MTQEAVVLWAALCTGFFFMLRASEFLLLPGRGWSADRVLQGRNVAGRRSNEECQWLADADEVIIEVTSSKTDQYNEGATRNHF